MMNDFRFVFFNGDEYRFENWESTKDFMVLGCSGFLFAPEGLFIVLNGMVLVPPDQRKE